MLRTFLSILMAISLTIQGAAAPAPTPPPEPPSSVRGLTCALDRYRQHLEHLEARGQRLSGASALKWGREFDKYRVAVWESLARQGFVVRKDPLIGGTGAHVFKLPDTDRYEIWVEKQFVDLEGKTWRGDNVIFDLETRKGVMADITSRSPDDPVVQRRFRLRFEGDGALEHDATNRLRAKALQDLIHARRPDLGDIQIEAVTPEGYRTFTERHIAERRSAARARLGGGGGPGPATAFIASIIVSMMVSTLVTPAQVHALETTETERAGQTLEQMVRAYASGDFDRGRVLRARWDTLDGPIWANGLPLPSDLNRVKLLEQIGEQLDKLEREGRDAYLCRQLCRRAENERLARLREAEAILANAVDQLRRAHEETYTALDQRIERWRAMLLPLRARKGTTSSSATRGLIKWDDVESAIAADGTLRVIRGQQKEGESAIAALQAGTIDVATARGRIQRQVAYSLQDYWWGFAVGAANWVHHGIRQDHAEAIDALAKEYEAARKALDARRPAAGAAEALALDRAFRAREEPPTNELSKRYRAVYDRLAEETYELTAAIREIDPELGYRADQMLPGGVQWNLMDQGSYTYSFNVYYRSSEARMATLKLWASDSFKKNPAAPPTATPSVSAWVNGIRVNFDTLQSVREGTPLTFSAGTAPGDAPPPLPTWPREPPRTTRERADSWSLERASPPQALGPVFQTLGPLLRAQPAQTSMLRLQAVAGAELQKPIAFTPNAAPDICMDIADTREKRSTLLTWRIADPDAYDKVRWKITAEGSKDDASGDGQAVVSGSRMMTWDKAGAYRIQAAADDGLDRREATFEVKVMANHSPTMTGGVVVSEFNKVKVGDPFEVRVTAIDPDPDEELRFVVKLPRGLIGLGERTCEPSTTGWTCIGLVRADAPGRYSLAATVLDPSDASDTMRFDVTAEE